MGAGRKLRAAAPDEQLLPAQCARARRGGDPEGRVLRRRLRQHRTHHGAELHGRRLASVTSPVAARDDSDDAIDNLYRGPLTEFTAARNALVKEHRGADASRIRKLAKPSVVAWAVNQVYWQARKTYDELIKSGEMLRKAQIAALEGKNADIRASGDAHRRAIADAVKEAERLAGPSGSHPSPDALMRTFEALSLAAEPPETPGRLTKELQPAGFEALTGVTPQPVTRATVTPFTARPSAPATKPSSPSSAKKRERDEAAARRQAEEEEKAAQKAAKQHEADIRKAEAGVEEARAAEALARKAFDRATQAVIDAESKLKALRARHSGLH